jgi:diguanylate cyclase (GGDEF)-like protein/PAS domain S-box-containing protein
MYNFFTGKALLSLAVFASSTGLIIGWYLLYRCIASSLVYRINALLFFVLLLYMVYIGGADGSKALWCYVFPLVAYFLLGNREGTAWIAALFLGCQVLIWNPFQLPMQNTYPADFSIRFSLSLLCIAIITSFYEKFRYTYRTEIERQNRLLNIQIIERQRAEEALRKSEKKYKAIYLQAAEGIIVIDSAGTVLECNPQMNTMLGYPSDELVGVNIYDLIHPEDLQNIPSQMPEILSGETVLLERRMRTAEGDYRLFERSGRRVEDNRILLLYRDITDRKAAEIALAKANRELDRLANIDGLTQIANRRKFESSLRAEWQRLAREQLPLTMILGDIDYFKQYNDLYGHQEGDACLITIAQTLSHILNRPADMVARFGGEEFIILLPNTALEGGIQIAETIRKAIAGLRIPHQGSECSPYVTMSLGVGSLTPSRSILPDDLVAVADKALYRAKQDGRNRVVMGDSRLLG